MMARTGILALVGAWAGLMIGAQPAGAQTVDTPTARTQAWASDLAAIVAADTGAVPPRLPTTAFAALPPFRQPQLSPDGLRFAAIVSSHGREDVVIIDVTGATKTVELGLSSEFELQSYRWAGNGTLLISVGKAAEWRNDDALMTRLIAYDLASKSEKFIGSSAEGMIGDDVLWVAPDGKRILLAYQRDVSSYPSVFSVDLATNKSTVAADAINHIWYWHADTDGVVRSGFGYTDGALQAGSNLNATGRWLAVYRKTATEPFHPIAVDSADDPDPFGDGAEIAGGNDTGLTLGTDAKTGFTAVYAFDFSRLKRGDPVFEAPSSDIADFDATDDGKALRAAWYVEDRPRVKWGDDEMQAFQANLDKAVNHDNPDGGYIAQVISHNANYDRRIVWVGAANDPGYYYFYQQVNGKMDRMAALNPALPPSALATPHYVHYTARDGLSIPAYLTLPKGRSARGLPLIILPHGGPFWVRDDGTFDADVQFLANRGYAVLQPEFRGSASYGSAFHDKGKGQWGRAMQDDIDDGMDWLVHQGVVDPKRVCLVGSSYGGYAALWGATRNPERYRCAASFAGVTDIERQLKYSNHFDDDKQSQDDWRLTVQGDPGFDLKTVSPLYTVARLKVPVLVVHGDQDQRVLPKQGKLYADALKAAGKDFDYVVIPGEGHGFSTSANAQIWYDHLDAFLARYNPAD
jgi:dienelactone hydrolase